MYRPTIKSNLWLGLMTLVFVGIYYGAESSRITVKAEHFERRLQAAESMERALVTLQNYRLPGVTDRDVEGGSDPLIYTMLGDKDSPITTDEGSIDDKVTVLNPNFAAVVVGLMERLGLQKGDTIAVLLTGSMPGANIAVYAAANAFGLHVQSITSVGSSWWGANAPDFTWLDMERVLNEQGVFPYRSAAASAGGSDDGGGLRLSDEGRMLISQAVDRNEVIYIHEGSLSANIKARMEILGRGAPLRSYKALVNVGGGIAAIGHHANGRLIPTGVSTKLPELNYPNRGVVHLAAEQGMPIIHLYDVTRIARDNGLPIAALPLPKAGTGTVFSHVRYNLASSWAALLVMFAILVIVKYFDRKRYIWREQGLDPDTLV